MNEEIIKQANELVDKYFDPESSNILFYALEYDQAKQCALIAVDEILNNNCGSHTEELNATNSDIYCDEYFWQEVKQAIENL